MQFVLIKGKGWSRVDGELKQLDSGPNGAVWGVNRANKVFFRGGVTSGRPTGRYWIHISGRRLNFVSPGCSGVFGVGSNGRIWRYRGMDNIYLILCSFPVGHALNEKGTGNEKLKSIELKNEAKH